MRKAKDFVFGILCFYLIITPSFAAASPIKHVVTLMLENRSFDHMLGYLKKLNPNINGLNGNEWNPVNPADPNSPKITVSFDAPQQLKANPGHSVPQTTTELWGSPKRVDPASMNGFILEMTQSGYSLSDAELVMKCFNTTSLPVLSSLAMEYGLFDSWHASIPGPTGPNRMMALSGTSHGATENDSEKEAEGYPQRTIFDDLFAENLPFKIYYGDFPVCLELISVREYPLHMHTMDAFTDDCKSGNLPAFSWIEPRWFDFLEWQENSEHPGLIDYMRSGNVLYGEMLTKQVYEAVRASPAWNETLLVIYYDEHGGLYDHVPPPQNDVPNPDGINGTTPPFDFTRLGIRVPCVLVSPWINKGEVIHEPTVNHYDHTSLLHTLRKLFGMSHPPLTKREAWSATFEEVFTQRSSPRTDCPATVPLYQGSEKEWEKFMFYQNVKETPELIEKLKAANPNHLEESAPMHDLQQEIVNVASGIFPPMRNVKEIKRVHEGAEFVREQINAYLQHAKSK